MRIRVTSSPQTVVTRIEVVRPARLQAERGADNAAGWMQPAPV